MSLYVNLLFKILIFIKIKLDYLLCIWGHYLVFFLLTLYRPPSPQSVIKKLKVLKSSVFFFLNFKINQFF
jgi:hypothetical protein